jgi:hypothetical protein
LDRGNAHTTGPAADLHALEYFETEIFLNGYDDPGPIIRAFAFPQRVSAACVAMTVAVPIRSRASCYAFVEAGAHARLVLPSRGRHSLANSIPAPANNWPLIESGGGASFADIAQRS